VTAPLIGCADKLELELELLLELVLEELLDGPGAAPSDPPPPPQPDNSMVKARVSNKHVRFFITLPMIFYI
jgi:hypothetical protein